MFPCCALSPARSSIARVFSRLDIIRHAPCSFCFLLSFIHPGHTLFFFLTFNTSRSVGHPRIPVSRLQKKIRARFETASSRFTTTNKLWASHSLFIQHRTVQRTSSSHTTKGESKFTVVSSALTHWWSERNHSTAALASTSRSPLSFLFLSIFRVGSTRWHTLAHKCRDPCCEDKNSPSTRHARLAFSGGIFSDHTADDRDRSAAPTIIERLAPLLVHCVTVLYALNCSLALHREPTLYTR